MSFARPEWLYLLILIPALAGFAWFRWRQRGQRWKRLIARRLLFRLASTDPGWQRTLRFSLILTALALLVIAFARPEGEEMTEVRSSEGRNILFLLDVSRSMMTEDSTPNRLAAAKAAAQEILDTFPNDRAGLIIFAGESYVQVPLTVDRSYLRTSLQQARPGDLAIGGSDLAGAMEEALELFEKTGQKSNVMVVLSDGEEHTTGLQRVAQDARDASVFIYSLGFGTLAGGRIPDPTRRDGLFRDRRGQIVQSALNDTSLRLIAQETGGVYSQGVGAEFLRQLRRTVAEMESFELEGRNVRLAKPLYHWFTLPAIFLIVLAVLSRFLQGPNRLSQSAHPGRVAVLLIGLLLYSPHSLQADSLTEAKNALAAGDYLSAARQFTAAAQQASGDRATRYRLAAAAAAARSSRWDLAQSAFGDALASENPALQKEAWLGLSTSLFKQGVETKDPEERKNLWEEAAARLQESLATDPDQTAARENLQAIQKALELLLKSDEKPEQQEKKDQQNQDQEDPQKENEEQNPQEEGDQPKDSENADQQKQQGEQQDQQSGEEDTQEGEKQQAGDEDQNKNQNSQKEGDQPEDSENSSSEGAENDQKQAENGEGQEKQEGADPDNETASQDPQRSEDSTAETSEERQERLQQAEAQRQETQETPEEQARRLLRLHSDIGRHPPRNRRYIPRRPSKDW